VSSGENLLESTNLCECHLIAFPYWHKLDQMTIPFSAFWLRIGLTPNMPINQGIMSKFDEFVS